MTAVQKGEKIMKKRSLWILTVSALLCLSMLLVACEPAVPGDGTGDDTKLVDEEVDYSALLSKWKEYITPVGVKEDGGYYNDYSSATLMPERDGYSSFGNFYYKEVETPTDIIGLDKYSLYIYDANLNSILTFEEASYSETINDWAVSYSFSDVLVQGNVIGIRKEAWNEEKNLWEHLYSYYGTDGKLIAELDEGAYDFGTGFVLGEKSYHFNDDGKLFYTGHATEDYLHTEKYEYEFTAANGKKYGYMDFDGSYLMIYDDNYTVVAERALGVDDQWFILDNGDVYVYTEEELPDDSDVYDCEDDKYGKFRFSHKLISAATGECREVDLSFLLIDVYTNYDTPQNGVKLKEGYAYAEILRVDENGNIANDPEFIIVDNTLTEVVSLPKLFKNQYSFLGAKDGSSLIINTERKYRGSDECDHINYSIDISTYEIERYIGDWNDFDGFSGGYIVDGRVFSLAGEELFDFDGEEYEVIFGNVFYSVKGEYKDIYDKQEKQKADIYVGAAVDGKWVSNLIATTEKHEISGGENDEDTVFTVVREKVVHQGDGLYLVMTTTETENKTTNETETVIDYTLYGRYGNVIEKYYYCTNAYIEYFNEDITLVVVEGYETNRYIIK